MLKYLPNSLTILRLLLVLPLGLLILRQEFGLALAIGALAGITDALDGFAARKLNAVSRLGAALDPVADKLLITTAFLCFASIALIPWYVALIVVGRDLVIVCGALYYHFLVAPLEFAATQLSKINMVVQICFCFLLLTAQLLPDLPVRLIQLGTVAALLIAVISGLDYMVTWSRKARQSDRGER